MPPFDESKMAQLVIANEADISLNISPATMPTLFAQNPKLITHSGQNSPFGYVDWWPSSLGFNCMTPPWDDPEIRWAISYAIDREQLVQFGYRGAGQATTVPYPYYPPLVEYIEGINDLLEQYPTNAFDPAKTAEILTAKGYAKDADGFWAKDGERLTMEITTFQVFAEVAPVVTQQLQTRRIRRHLRHADRLLRPADDRRRRGEHLGPRRQRPRPLRHARALPPEVRQADRRVHLPVLPLGERRVRRDRRPDGQHPRRTTRARRNSSAAPWRSGCKNLPDVQLLQFYHRIPMNTTYWTGWPSAEDPYINEAFWHRTFIHVLTRLTPTQ